MPYLEAHYPGNLAAWKSMQAFLEDHSVMPSLCYHFLINITFIQISAIEEVLTFKISSDCRCNFTRDDLHDSSVKCSDSGELVYFGTLEYSNDEGSETASVIANRLIGQAPFSMTVQGTPLTVTSGRTVCVSSLSSAAGGGLFIGGFVLATLLTIIIFLVIM